MDSGTHFFSIPSTIFFWLVVSHISPLSRAQHGYEDPSSTDKDAANEVDEVDLQVLCLTGEEVNLSVPRSMLGHDLARLVSKKLPRKPRAKLAVHHDNQKLTLDQTLGK